MPTPECYSRDLAVYGRFLIQLPLQARRNPFNLVEHIYLLQSTSDALSLAFVFILVSVVTFFTLALTR